MDKKIAEKAAERILESLKNGVVPWQNPWLVAGAAKSHTTGKAYSMLNQMTLDGAGEWITYRQAQKEGGQVRKGATGRRVVFWKIFGGITPHIELNEETGELETYITVKKTVPYLRYYTVFNINDCDGIKQKYPDPPLPNRAQRQENAEAIIADYISRESGLKVYRDDTAAEAYYNATDDSIRIPKIEQFYSVEGYYNTVFHELAHSTRHPSRLNREKKDKRFGSKDYAQEELVAEITASAICAHLGLTNERQEKQNAAYCENWYKIIKNDPDVFVIAASRAQKAVELLLNITTEEEEPEPETTA